jgi:hypothetical protein
MWSDGDLKQYMAVTAHWMEQSFSSTGQQQVNLRADLIGFVHVPGSHTGDRLAEVFLFILNRMELAKKVLLMSFNFNFNFNSPAIFFKDWLGDNRQCIQQYIFYG